MIPAEECRPGQVFLSLIFFFLLWPALFPNSVFGTEASIADNDNPPVGEAYRSAQIFAASWKDTPFNRPCSDNKLFRDDTTPLLENNFHLDPSLWPSPCVERVRISFHRHIPILDLPGGDFLKIYLGALLIGILIAFLTRVLLRQPHYGPILESAPLDQYETAYLAGEEERALHAVLVSLLHRGLLVVNKEDKSFSTQGELPSSAHLLEKNIFRAAQAEILTIEELKKATSQRVEPIRKKLETLGLLLSKQRARIVRTASGFPLLAVSILGVIKIAIGISQARPVGFLLILSQGALLAAIGFFLPVHRTHRGDRALTSLKKQNGSLQWAAKSDPATLNFSDMALAVALFDLDILSADFQNKIKALLKPPRTDGYGGADGGGCGGGCGGCGGCGG